MHPTRMPGALAGDNDLIKLKLMPPPHNDHNPPVMGGSRKFKALRFVVLPLAVFVLANVIFSLTAFNLDLLVAAIIKLIHSGRMSMTPFMEARARLTWATMVLLFYATLIAVGAFCVAIMRRSLTAKGKVAFVIAGALLALAVLGHMAYSGHFRTEFSYIFFYTFDPLAASQRYTANQLLAIKALVGGINVLVALVAILALITGCCILSEHQEPHKSKLDSLAEKMRQLKMFIGMVSTLLVAGVLHTVAWLHWPAALIAKDPLAKPVLDFSEAMGLYWGVTFSLLIATFYIPAAWSLCKSAESLLAAHPEEIQGLEAQDWLQKHHLTLSPLQQVPQMFAILAPLLAGPLGATFGTFSGLFVGG